MSSGITVEYQGSMNAMVEMPDSSTLATGAPKSCGGNGSGPSPKDLFVAGYASCMIMAADVAARKAGFDISGAKIEVSPVWALNKPVLEELNSTLLLPCEYTEEQLNVLRKGECYCPIHNSLLPEVKTTLTFETA
jgi:uncharacterized OsmC-like protein